MLQPLPSPTTDARRWRRTLVALLLVSAVVLGSSQSSVVAASSGTRVGATVSKNSGETRRQAFLRVRAKYGGELGAVRVFFPGLPASWRTIRNTYGTTPVVVSFAPKPGAILSGKHDAALRAWFKDAPTDRPVWWSYWHEPENDAPRAFTLKSYRKAWRRIAGIAERAGVGNRVHATLILMCWTLAKNSGRNWRDYYAGADVIDAFGFDCYNGGRRKGRYRPVEDILDPAFRLSQRTGKPWGVAELGSTVVRGDDGAGRARWLRSYAAYTRNHGAKFATYFDTKTRLDFRLRDRPSRSAWRDAVERSVG